ncbi:MAG TPA: HU family DNA-binding protein [Bryobacterales bacterium]|nr:HU family DNA-binding protein [Bryobacterales bacterium]
MATTKTKKKMTQTEFVKKIAEVGGVTNKVAKEIIQAYADIAIAETKRNGVFVLPGIGRLKKVERKARIGRNPQTGEKIRIPAKKVVKFTVSKACKEAIVPPRKKK